MNNYYIKAILLHNCPYSHNAFDLIKKYQLHSKITWVSNDDKLKYKTTSINTFPQIFLQKYNSHGSILLGGFDDIQHIYNTFYNKKYSESNITQFMAKYNCSKKILLRLIQLINNIN